MIRLSPLPSPLPIRRIRAAEEPPTPAPSACCAPEDQATCCAPTEKPACCGPKPEAPAGGCGCR